MRRTGMWPDDVLSAEDLARLPVLERWQIQREPDRFLSRARPRSEYLALRTGGSSGAPCVVYHDLRSVLETTAHNERHQQILRALVGKRRIRVLGIGSPKSANAERRRFVSRHALIPRSAVTTREGRFMSEKPEAIARDLERIRPDVVMSYGSYRERLAMVLESGRGRFFVPRIFAYSGDVMSEAARKRITETLGAYVWSSYQAVESPKIAFECEQQGGLHVHADLCSVRIVDAAGHTVPDGVGGDVVISNLVNRATVLLNYRLGDVAAFRAERCGCGRDLPLLSFPMGRVDDWLEFASGERVHTQSLRTVFTDEKEVWQYQIIQEGPAQLRVTIVPADHADREGITARVASGIAHVVGPGVSLALDFAEDVERTASGKVRVILRKSPASQPAMPYA